MTEFKQYESSSLMSRVESSGEQILASQGESVALCASRDEPAPERMQMRVCRAHWTNWRAKQNSFQMRRVSDGRQSSWWTESIAPSRARVTCATRLAQPDGRPYAVDWWHTPTTLSLRQWYQRNACATWSVAEATDIATVVRLVNE